MGTGNIPDTTGHQAANALWMFDSHTFDPRPPVRDDFVAWPPAGYVPYTVVYARWSFGYLDADFSGATVSMTQGASSVSVTLEAVLDGYGENTLVWRPMGLGSDAAWPQPSSDTTYTVQIQNVIINSQSHNFQYDVTVIDPES